MITASIDLSKVDKAHLVPGKNGANYLDIILRSNPGKHGTDGFIAQGVSKEKREKGIKGPILGGYKEYSFQEKPTEKPTEKPKEPDKPLFPPEEDKDPFA